MAKKDKKVKTKVEEEIMLDIPEEEIWSYQVPGLAAPHINKPYKYYTFKKIIFALVIIVAVSLSMYLSLRTVQNEVFDYTANDNGTYELKKFSNNSYIFELDIDYVTTVEYNEEAVDGENNMQLIKDETQKITSIRQYALNCDDKVKVINIGPEVEKIDGKAFYSCWALERIEVDENNPYYCDVDGVLYNKDMTTVICHPTNHDAYLAEKYGYVQEDMDVNSENYDEAKYQQYKKDVLTYVVPSTVTTIGELCFNYANLVDVYVPEGLKSIETLGFFEMPALQNIYSYVATQPVTDAHFTTVDTLGEIYLSLPEGLEYIGSDAFSYNQAMSYMYIPDTVTYIGHHAFWDTVYKEGSELRAVTVMNVAVDEDSFKNNVETGTCWRPQYDYMLFKKSIDINYSAERAEIATDL